MTWDSKPIRITSTTTGMAPQMNFNTDLAEIDRFSFCMDTVPSKLR
jgi:hypothetical protein